MNLAVCQLVLALPFHNLPPCMRRHIFSVFSSPSRCCLPFIFALVFFIPSLHCSSTKWLASCHSVENSMSSSSLVNDNSLIFSIFCCCLCCLSCYLSSIYIFCLYLLFLTLVKRAMRQALSSCMVHVEVTSRPRHIVLLSVQPSQPRPTDYDILRS